MFMNMKPYKHSVQYYETDRMGIAHHSNYVRWMEEARMDFLSQIGFGYDAIEKMGIISPVTAVDCKYVKTTTFSEIVTIFVTVEEFKGVRLKLAYKMQNEEGETVFTGHSEHCFLNRDGQIMRIKKEYPELYRVLNGFVAGDN